MSPALQAEWKHEPSSLPSGWPTEGQIELRGFCLRYRHDLDLAIRNINITISGGEKVRLYIPTLEAVVYLGCSTSQLWLNYVQQIVCTLHLCLGIRSVSKYCVGVQYIHGL